MRHLPNQDTFYWPKGVCIREVPLYTSYSARTSPENTHKLLGFYMEVLILYMYMDSASLSCFLQNV